VVLDKRTVLGSGKKELRGFWVKPFGRRDESIRGGQGIFGYL